MKDKNMNAKNNRMYKVTHYGYGKPTVFPRVAAKNARAAMLKTVGDLGGKLAHHGFTTRFGLSSVSVDVLQLAR